MRRLALAVACIAPIATLAGTVSAETDLRVTVGVDGQYEVGEQIVVSVTVTADELIDGEIVITLGGMATSTRRDVQIAAGTTKEFYFSVPSSWEEPTIEVSVRDGRDEIASESVRARQRNAGEVVGLLPRLAARVGELPVDVVLGADLGRATVAALPTAVIDLGPSALRSYDSIAAGANDLAELDATQQDVLFAWVALGGILMLDDDAAAADVPAEWRPGPNGYSWADLGEVRLTDGEALAGHWDQVIQPTVMGTPAMFGGSEMMMDPQQDLARRAGLDLPTIAPLAIGIGLYALVLGPVVFLVLRRMRRLTLGWFVIPALAVLTAGGVAVAGGGALRNGNPATATFVHDSAGGSYAMSNVLTFSDSGGRADVALPVSWTLAGPGDMFWGGGGPVPIEVVRNGDGTAEASVSLEATQANVRLYSGLTERPGLTTTAAWDGDRVVSGTITNGAGVTLYDVAVFAGEDEALVGKIADGDSVEWELDALRNLRFSWDSRGTAVWGDPFANRTDGRFFDGPRAVGAAEEPANDLDERVDEPEDANGVRASLVEFGLWGAASGDIELFPTGMVRVVGWTTEIGSDLISDADASTVTAVSSLAAISSRGDAVNQNTTRAIAVRNPFMGPAPGNRQVFRYVLPATADPDELFAVGLANIGVDELAFWDGTGWLDMDVSADWVQVPDDAIRDGVVLVRTDVDVNRGPVGMPSLTDRAPEEQA